MRHKDTLSQDNRSSTPRPRPAAWAPPTPGLRPASGPQPGRARYRRRPMRGAVRPHASARGQSLVEFALAVPVFLLVTLGLLDGMRVIFYYSQIQEAARLGARWGAVQVGRAVPGSSTQAVGGTFADQGNAPGTYSDTYSATAPNCPSPLPVPPPTPLNCPITGSRWTDPANPVTNTIVGATMLGTTAVNPHLVTISISTTAGLTQTVETKDVDPDSFTNKPITVTVTYPFTPVLSMGLGAVTLKGSSTVLHE